MEILQLKYFCRAAETENFSRVASEFGVPPSNISQSVKRLERELSAELFSRSANSLKLNARGKEFYEAVSTALGILESAKTVASGSGETGRIRISIRTNRRIVMQAIEKFRLQYPEVDIIAKHNPEDKNEDFDIIISAEDMHGGFESIPLLEEGLLLATKRGGRLDSEGEMSSKELSDETFITMDTGTSMHGLTVRVGEKLGFRPRIALQSDDPFYIRRCVELGLGSVVVPSVSWRGQFSDDVVFRPFPDMSRTTYVSWRKRPKPSGCMNAFMIILAEECKKEGER